MLINISVNICYIKIKTSNRATRQFFPTEIILPAETIDLKTINKETIMKTTSTIISGMIFTLIIFGAFNMNFNLTNKEPLKNVNMKYIGSRELQKENQFKRIQYCGNYKLEVLTHFPGPFGISNIISSIFLHKDLWMPLYIYNGQDRLTKLEQSVKGAAKHNKIEFDTSQLPLGNYYDELKTDSKIFVEKIKK
jgi:hypothetical protein